MKNLKFLTLIIGFGLSLGGQSLFGSTSVLELPTWQACNIKKICYRVKALEGGTSLFFSEKTFVRYPVLELFKPGSKIPFQILRGKMGYWTPSSHRWTIQGTEKSFYFDTKTFEVMTVKESFANGS